MKNSNQVIKKLGSTHPLGFDLSLERIEKLLGKLENPHTNMPPTIHVAGTNGKGSVIAFCKAILEENNMKVNVHTSPHLVNWNERYYIGGDYVDDRELAETIEYVNEINGDEPSTVFEILSATMFVLFEKYKSDVCLVEVGLGGRFDATNVMPKTDVQVITPIGFDHEDWLGDTLEKIAFEKAGIMRENGIVISAEQSLEVQKKLEECADKLNCQFKISGRDYKIKKLKESFIFEDGKNKFELTHPELVGEHQIENAGVALAACSVVAQLSQEKLQKSMKKVEWKGRLQKCYNDKLISKLPKNSEIWLDGGHNAHAAQALMQFLEKHVGNNKKELVMICAMLTTKDAQGYFRTFAPLQPKLFVVSGLDTESPFYEPSELAKEAEKVGVAAVVAESVENAMEKINSNKEICLVICGSLYLVGDVIGEYP